MRAECPLVLSSFYRLVTKTVQAQRDSSSLCVSTTAGRKIAKLFNQNRKLTSYTKIVRHFCASKLYEVEG